MNSNKTLLKLCVAFLCIYSCMSAAVNRHSTSPTSVYDFTVKDVYGQEVPLDIFRGKVTLFVNIASEVHDDMVQYEGLKKLREKYHGYGLRIVALPSRQFAEIPKASDMQLMNYLITQHVEFDLFMAKGDVNGVSTVPFIQYLKKKCNDGLERNIMSRFAKFLVDRTGEYVNIYAERLDPVELSEDIKWLLA